MKPRGRSHLPYFLIGILSGCVVTLLTTSKVLQNSVVNSDDSFTLPNVDKADDLLAHGKDDGVDGNNVDDDDADAEPLVLHKHNGNLAYIIFHYECFGCEPKNNYSFIILSISFLEKYYSILSCITVALLLLLNFIIHVAILIAFLKVSMEPIRKTN